MLLSFNNSEQITESTRKKKEVQKIEIEVWKYENKKFTKID